MPRLGTALLVVNSKDVIFGLPLFQHTLQTELRKKYNNTHWEADLHANTLSNDTVLKPIKNEVICLLSECLLLFAFSPLPY